MNSALIEMLLYLRHSDSALFNNVTVSFATWHSRVVAVYGNCWEQQVAQLGRCSPLPVVPNRVSHRPGRILSLPSCKLWVRLAVKT